MLGQKRHERVKEVAIEFSKLFFCVISGTNNCVNAFFLLHIVKITLFLEVRVNVGRCNKNKNILKCNLLIWQEG